MSMRCSIADGEGWHLYLSTYDDCVYLDRGLDPNDEPQKIFQPDEWQKIEKEILSFSVKETQKLRAQLAIAKATLKTTQKRLDKITHNNVPHSFSWSLASGGSYEIGKTLAQLEIEPEAVATVEGVYVDGKYKGYSFTQYSVVWPKDSNEKT